MTNPITHPFTASSTLEAEAVFSRADEIAAGAKVRRTHQIDALAEPIARAFAEVWEPGLRRFGRLERPSDLIAATSGKVFELQLFVVGGPVSTPSTLIGRFAAKSAKGMIRRRLVTTLGVNADELDRLHAAAHDLTVRNRPS